MGEFKAKNGLFLFLFVCVILCTVGFSVVTLGLRNDISQLNTEFKLRRPGITVCTTRDSVRHALSKVGCVKHRVDGYAITIVNSCRDFKVDWKWIVAQMRRESYFNPSIRSSIKTQLKGDKKKEYACGLLQIKPSTGKEIARDLNEKYYDGILFDGVTNIRWGVYYFAKRMLVQQYDIENAVKAYNVGDGGLLQGKGSETHWQAVFENYSNICQLFSEVENGTPTAK